MTKVRHSERWEAEGRNDAHVHLWPSSYRSSARAPLPGFDATVDALMELMEVSHVRTAAVVTPAIMSEDNAYTLLAAQQADDRVVPIGAIAIFGVNGKEDVRRLGESGIRGLRVADAEGELNLTDPRLDSLWGEIAERRLPVHFNVPPKCLKMVAVVARRIPETTLVIDHLGRPDVMMGTEAPNFQALLALARNQNVWVKTANSGYFSREGFPHLDLVPFFHAVVKAFGVNRVMWGSDWPVCTDYGDYASAVEPWWTTCQGLEDNAASKIFGQNFERLYRGGIQ